MKNIKVSFFFNLFLAGISFYLFIESLDKEIWRSVMSAIGCFIFAILTVLVFYKMKNKPEIIH